MNKIIVCATQPHIINSTSLIIQFGQLYNVKLVNNVTLINIKHKQIVTNSKLAQQNVVQMAKTMMHVDV